MGIVLYDNPVSANAMKVRFLLAVLELGYQIPLLGVVCDTDDLAEEAAQLRRGPALPQPALRPAATAVSGLPTAE